MMSQPWRCLNECPRVGLVRGRRDRAGFPGRGDAPARTRVTRLRVGKLLARSQSRQTDCPRFSRHTRWPPGTDPSPRETQTTPATTVQSVYETQTTPTTTIQSLHETQTTSAPRKTLKNTNNQPAGAVPVTSGNLTTSSTHRSDTPVKPRPPQLREKPSNTPKNATQGRSRLHQPKHRVPQGRSRLHQPGHHTTRRGPTVSAARRQVRRPRHRLGAPRACLSRAQPGPSPGRRRARRGRGGSARR